MGESTRVRLNRDLKARLRLVAMNRRLGLSATIRALLKERLDILERTEDAAVLGSASDKSAIRQPGSDVEFIDDGTEIHVVKS